MSYAFLVLIVLVTSCFFPVISSSFFFIILIASWYSKPFALGTGVGLDPQRHNFCVTYTLIPTCWYLRTLKFALPPTQILKCALPQTRNPNASQWNIGCVGFQAQHYCIGHVHFMLFVSISFQWVANANAVFSGRWA